MSGSWGSIPTNSQFHRHGGVGQRGLYPHQQSVSQAWRGRAAGDLSPPTVSFTGMAGSGSGGSIPTNSQFHRHGGVGQRGLYPHQQSVSQAWRCRAAGALSPPTVSFTGMAGSGSGGSIPTNSQFDRHGGVGQRGIYPHQQSVSQAWRGRAAGDLSPPTVSFTGMAVSGSWGSIPTNSQFHRHGGVGQRGIYPHQQSVSQAWRCRAAGALSPPTVSLTSMAGSGSGGSIPTNSQFHRHGGVGQRGIYPHQQSVSQAWRCRAAGALSPPTVSFTGMAGSGSGGSIPTNSQFDRHGGVGQRGIYPHQQSVSQAWRGRAAGDLSPPTVSFTGMAVSGSWGSIPTNSQFHRHGGVGQRGIYPHQQSV